jgi:molecular chaperone GrpE (heat shock protein)
MSAAFNDFANTVDAMNRAKAARRQAQEDAALWTGREALMKCLYQALTDASHPLKCRRCGTGSS